MGARTIIVVATVLMTAVAANAQTHAPWPTNWNNWNDPALWATVGNPGNAGELSGIGAGGVGPDAVVGGVGYVYKIGTYEVTAGQYTAFLNAVAKTDTFALYNPAMWSDRHNWGCKIQQSGSPGDYTYSVAPDWANRPVNNVSWGDAARFVNWLTNGQHTGAQDASTTEDGSYDLHGVTDDATLMSVTRKTVAQGGRYYIPTEDEWYKAAYHKNDGVTGNYFDYPTGSNALPDRDMTDMSGNNANYWTGSESGTYPIDSDKYTTVVGEFQNSASPYGTFDQGGNLWEWDEAIVNGSNRGVRGGSFGLYAGGDLYASFRLGYSVPSYESSFNGFRIVQIPEPAALSLLALGGLAAVRKRRQ